MLEMTRFVYCPSCGNAALEVYKTKAMKCTECDYVYFHNTASAVAAIIETDRGILVTVRACNPFKDAYDLPGGFVDYNESLETACKREVREEVNIEVEITEYLGSFPNRYQFGKVTYISTDAFFICRYSGERKPSPGPEAREIHYFPPESLPFDGFGFDSNVHALTAYSRRM